MPQKLEAVGGAVKFRDTAGGWQIGRILDKRPLLPPGVVLVRCQHTGEDCAVRLEELSQYPDKPIPEP